MVALLASVVLKLLPSTTVKMNKIAERPINHEPSEMQMSFMDSSNDVGADPRVRPQGAHIGPPRQSHVRAVCYFLTPWRRMCCISSELGAPSKLAGLKPNGPPSVFAASVMLSPCAYA